MCWTVWTCVPFTWEQGEGDRVDAVILGGAGALGVGDVHLEFHRFLENRRTSCGLVLRPEAGLRDDAVAQAGDLRGSRLWVSRNTDNFCTTKDGCMDVRGRDRSRRRRCVGCFTSEHITVLCSVSVRFNADDETWTDSSLLHLMLRSTWNTQTDWTHT